MNETILPADNLSDVPWPTSDVRVPVPDTSMLSGSEKAPPAAVGLLKSAVQGAHDTIDRLAESAAPAVRRWGDGAADAEVALHERADQLREVRDAWAETVRTTVRDNPLAAVVAALALGVVIARLTR